MAAIAGVGQVDKSKPAISCMANAINKLAYQLFENFDTTGDGKSDSRVFLWQAGKGILQSDIDTANYDLGANVHQFTGNGDWGTLPVNVTVDVKPSALAGYTEHHIVAKDGNGKVVVDATLNARAFLYKPV